MTRSGFRLTLLLGLFQAVPLMAQDLTLPYVEGQVLVRFQPGLAAADRAAVRGALLPTGGQEIRLVPGLELVQTPLSVTQAIATLGNSPNVLYVEPDYILQPEGIPNDYYFGLEWGLNNTGQDINQVSGVPDADIDMVEAWDELATLLPNGAEVVVAVIDSGTQRNHEDLAPNIWVNTIELNGNVGEDDDGNGYIDDINGWDFYSNDNNPDDENGHGTHTAGTIAAVTDNNKGVAGVCGNVCKIMPLRFLGPNGGATSAAVLALEYAVDKGVRVSNNSWGGGGYSQSLVSAIEAAEGQGHVFVTSAGNSGINTDYSPHYPSSYPNANIISVAATDNLDLLAWFSNFGATSVDIGAPGFDVASTYMNNEYWWMSGTSMATPHVTGIVALLLAIDPSLTVPALKDRVLTSARPLAALNGLTVTGGMLNAYGALSASVTEPNPPPAELPPIPDQPTVAPTVTNQGDGTAMISWTEVADATFYVVQREEWKTRGKNGASWSGLTTLTGNETSTSYEDNPGAKTVRYRFAAGNAAGTSDFSPWSDAADITDSGSTSGGSGGGGGSNCRPKKNC